MKNLLFIVLLSFGLTVHAQVAINNDGSIPDNSAMLDIKSDTKGLLTPRMSTAQRLAISTPAEGLLLFDTSAGTFWYFNGTNWIDLAGSASPGWLLTGNSGTDTAINFIGTIDNQPLRFRVNNAWAGELHPTNGNVSFGLAAGQSITTGLSNTAIGRSSLYGNTSGNFNTAAGEGSLVTNTTGSFNAATGYQALYSNSTGSYNVANGTSALYSNTTGDNNTANGYQALNSNTSGFNNTANGYKALFSNTTGIYNNANGFRALYSNTIGNYNTANGVDALYYNSDGSSNTATGSYALFNNTWGSFNTANGLEALFSNITGTENTANGNQALYSNTVGYENTASGFQALLSNTTGYKNTAFGSQALFTNLAGDQNTSIGSGTLSNNTTGNRNTAIGPSALINNTTGTQNIAIGYNSGPAPGFINLFNTIGIGNDGSYQHGGSNQVVIGNASMLVIAGKVGWSVLSDARIKNTIKEDVKGLDFILKLRPVTYHISNAAITAVTGSKETPDFPGKYDGEKVKYSGFIAQEVEQAARAANYEFSGYDTPKNERGLYTIKYAEFVVPLVKAVQELNLKMSQFENLKMENEEIKKQNAELIKRIEKIEKLIALK